jgi:hypothetical protein
VTKVSGARPEPYVDFIDYFFAEKDLHFRALIASKEGLSTTTSGRPTTSGTTRWFRHVEGAVLARWQIPRVSGHQRYARKGEGGEAHDVQCNNMYDFSRRLSKG